MRHLKQFGLVFILIAYISVIALRWWTHGSAGSAGNYFLKNIKMQGDLTTV